LPRNWPLTPKLSRRFLLTLLGITIATYSVVYLFSVPFIKQKVFEIERDSSRLVLDNVTELASRMYSNVEGYRKQALESHQQKLKVAVSLTEALIQTEFQSAEAALIPASKVREKVFSVIRKFKYDENNYIWIADYQGTLLSHPDPRFYGVKSPLDDGVAKPVLEKLLKQVRKEGEGFYAYQWNRPQQKQGLDKVSFIKDYPEWGFVIGSGVYLDDLEKEVQVLKQQALPDLRNALLKIKLAKTGYLYIFDAQKNMLIHPNINIDGTRFNTLTNPLSKQPIADELISIADTGEELHYLWDKPDDPGNYIYEKRSLVRYLPGFDWYICSSVYLDELSSSSELLSNRLLTLATVTLLISWILGLFFVGRITRPLEHLSMTAEKVQQGDLSARSNLVGDDEVGKLAHSFDSMVMRLENNIDTLDSQVKRRTEEMLEAHANAQRMKAVGQLAGGLAHDFNNLLSIILGNLSLLKDRNPSNEELNNFLDPAIKASQRGTNITHRLLAFARKQPLRPTTVQVNQLLTDTCVLLRGSLPSSITLETVFSDEALAVNVDAALMESALINLALNARDAMPKGGVLSLESSLCECTQPQHDYDETVPAGRYVCLLVTDTGSGFNEESLQKAFEPFFTTKTELDNSGLGLSMVYGFVKQSNGYIHINSKTGEGAAINVLLPAVDYEANDTSPNKAPASSQWLKNQLALLVEDDADVRRVVREQLMSFGLNIIEASSAQEAEQLIKNIPHLDLLVSDVRLQGVSAGPLLAELFAAQGKSRIILLMSGYTHSVQIDGKQGVLTFPLLRKPFDKEALYDALLQAHHALIREEVHDQ